MIPSGTQHYTGIPIRLVRSLLIYVHLLRCAYTNHRASRKAGGNADWRKELSSRSIRVENEATSRTCTTREESPPGSRGVACIHAALHHVAPAAPVRDQQIVRLPQSDQWLGGVLPSVGTPRGHSTRRGVSSSLRTPSAVNF